MLFTGDLTFHALQQIQLDALRETSQTELSLNLKRTAQEKGFVISDNQGEGNCMFFALSEQLDVVKGMRGCLMKRYGKLWSIILWTTLRW